MSKMKWDQTGDRYYETGVEQGALYPMDASGKYPEGFAWSGLTGVTETPSGAESTKVYADNDVYITLTSKETFSCTITAYQSPEEFDACDGAAELADGITIGQQSRQKFGLAYKTKLGNDVAGDDKGYILHLVYGLTASPSSRDYKTINDSPEAQELSWEASSNPVAVTGHKATSILKINSTKIDADKLAKLETALYGGTDEAAKPYLPTPDEVLTIIA